jgi:cobalt/nickel transport system permease protein
MSPIVLALGWIAALAGLALSVRAAERKLDERQIPLMAVLAAGIFVAQMLNFPIFGGTTGHLLGAALAVIMLGPLGGILVLSVILIIQCLFFGDGGITSLGLNILNMAVVGSITAHFANAPFRKNVIASTLFASWLSVVAAAFACAVELALSDILSGGVFGIIASVAFPTMLSYHVVIGIGEALITTSVIFYTAQVRPEVLDMRKISLKDAFGGSA